VPRIFLCVAALAVVAVASRAEQSVGAQETLIRLSVRPAPPAKPALRYLLLPELKEMNPGNPIQDYLKCFMAQEKFFFDKEAFERREKLLVMPLENLPAAELRDYGSSALAQADWAARLDTPDWQILLKVKTVGVSLLLPDVQQMQMLAKALKVRFRSEVALRRFDDALRTAKTMFAMSRHLGEHPTLIGGDIGFAIADLALGPLEEILEQPGCPNLYWALTNLPSPLVTIDKGLEGERALVLVEFRDFDASAPMSAEQLGRLTAYLDRLLLKPGNWVRNWLDARTKDQTNVSAARRRLVDHGLAEERLPRFPVDQVILLDEKREFEVRRDDLMKTMALPSWQADALAGQTRATQEPALFTDALLEGVYSTRRRQVRLDQRIALLRHVEALRIYAAEHAGTLPANLGDFPVPLPDDPFTGKPFRYEVAGNTAHLRGSPPAGMEKDPTYNVHYSVTLKR
jgi:hypothetical protein